MTIENAGVVGSNRRERTVFRTRSLRWLEKLGMLAAGTLRRPIDIVDLLFHAAPVGLLILKLARLAWLRLRV